MPQLSFQNLGNLGFFMGLFALLISLWGFSQIRGINHLRKTFFAGKNGQDLENLILTLNQRLLALQSENLMHAEEIKKLADNLNFAVQKVGLVRYSPFADGGGNYSFSLALLDAHNSGLVMTNMYGRQNSRVYTKKLNQGKSEVQLTEEEIRAIALANSQK